jgi:uncharacterized membrane-anchored protein YitT (DUF2179 family)
MFMLRKLQLKLTPEFAFKHIKRILGSALMSLGYVLFIVPAYIMPGGIIGLAAVVRKLTGLTIPLGTMTWLINIVLYAATMHLLGYKHILKVLWNSTLFAFFIDLFTPLANKYVLGSLYAAGTTTGNPNLLLYAIAGGAMIGAATALIYRSEGATGGSDAAAYALHRLLPRFTLAQWMLFVDAVIIAMTVIVAGNLTLALYAGAVKFTIYKVVDGLLSGVNFAKEAQIISKNHERISARILAELNRGVTAFLAPAPTPARRRSCCCASSRPSRSRL